MTPNGNKLEGDDWREWVRREREIAEGCEICRAVYVKYEKGNLEGDIHLKKYIEYKVAQGRSELAYLLERT